MNKVLVKNAKTGKVEVVATDNPLFGLVSVVHAHTGIDKEKIDREIEVDLKNKTLSVWGWQTSYE